MWRESGKMKFNQPEHLKQRASLTKVCVGGFLVNILNPKLSVFFLAFLPQFVPSNETSPFPLIISMSLVFMGITLGVFIFYGLAAAKISAYVISSPSATKWIQRSFAGAFAAFGMKLALIEN